MNRGEQEPPRVTSRTQLQSGGLSPSALTLRRVELGAAAVMLFVVLAGLDLGVRSQVDVAAPPLVVPAVVVMTFGVAGWIWTSASWRSWRWALDQANGQAVFTVESGVWRKVWRAVPLDRIQYVEVHTGLIERWLRLATVVVRTAGVHTPAVHLRGVDHVTADGLRLRLTPERQHPQ